MRFAFIYQMRDAEERVRAVAPKHASYWRELRLPRYVGGPFGDRSGGIVTFEAGSLSDAEALAADDPFVREDLLEEATVRQWVT